MVQALLALRLTNPICRAPCAPLPVLPGRRAARQHMQRISLPNCPRHSSHDPTCCFPLFPCSLQAQQALSVALNKVGELHHLQGDLGAAAEQYAQALQLRRSLLAATQRQWAQAAAQAQTATGSSGAGSQPAGGTADPTTAVGGDAAGPAAAEGDEACCSAALDLAASCLKLAGARRGLGQASEAEASDTLCVTLCSGAGSPCAPAQQALLGRGGGAPVAAALSCGCPGAAHALRPCQGAVACTASPALG